MKDLPLQVDLRKLGPRFIGPVEIERVVNPAVVRLKLPVSLKVHPTFHILWIKPVVESDLAPPIWIIDGAPAHTMARILNIPRRGRDFQYLIKWEGYEPDERSWVPHRQMFDRELLRAFYRENPDKCVRAPGGAC